MVLSFLVLVPVAKGAVACLPELDKSTHVVNLFGDLCRPLGASCHWKHPMLVRAQCLVVPVLPQIPVIYLPGREVFILPLLGLAGWPQLNLPLCLGLGLAP